MTLYSSTDAAVVRATRSPRVEIDSGRDRGAAVNRGLSACSVNGGSACGDSTLRVIPSYRDVQKTNKHFGPTVPSGGRVEVVWRGAFGMDAKRGMSGQGWPVLPTLGTAPERGELSAAKPGCRARFLFGYVLFCASKEKVTRRKAETGRRGQYRK
jgi:hypothetical protein